MRKYLAGTCNTRASSPSFIAVIAVIAPDFLEGLEENLSFEREHWRQVSRFHTKYCFHGEQQMS